MHKKSLNSFKEAKRYLVGGVNSPIRSFKDVGGNPLFIKKAKGSKIEDIDGNVYIDYVASYGPLILGHAHCLVAADAIKAVKKGTSFGAPVKNEVELAKLICQAFRSIDKVRFVSSGTEAVLGAVKLSQAYTKRDKIVSFKGCYHGWGVFPRIELPYNDIDRVKKYVSKNCKKIAAVIVEPVAGNMGVVIPDMVFLKTLRTLCNKYNIVLIFDEVITGFRIAFGGAQELFKIKADLTCLGKVIGGGLPVGAFGGKKELMDLVAPVGPVYQAGTLSGNPPAVAAGLTTLKLLKKLNPYQELREKTQYLCLGMKRRYNSIGSMFSFHFKDHKEYERFFWGMIKKGIYFAPSKNETNFVSVSHSWKDIETTIKGGRL